MPDTQRSEVFSVIFAGGDGDEYARQYRGTYELSPTALTITGVEIPAVARDPRIVTYPAARVIRVVETAARRPTFCIVCGGALFGDRGEPLMTCRTELGEACVRCAPVQYRTCVEGRVRIVDVWTVLQLEAMTATSARKAKASA